MTDDLVNKTTQTSLATDSKPTLISTPSLSPLAEYLTTQLTILNNPKERPDNKVVFATQTIVEADKKAGESNISKDEAKLLLPFLVIIFVDFTQSQLSYNQLAGKIIFVSGDPSDEGRMMGNRESAAVNSLKIEYPELRFNTEEEMRISLNLIDHLILGFTFREKIFIYLDKINFYKSDTKVIASYSEADTEQVNGNNLFKPVLQSTPFTLLISTIIHEFVHAQADKSDPLPIEANWADRVSKISKVDEVKKATTSGFRIHYVVSGDVLMTMDGFEEFFAFYLTEKICEKYQFYFSIINPDYYMEDFQTFDQVLQQSGITIIDLINYQKNCSTEDLFTKMTRRNSPENQFNLMELYSFATSLFLSFNQGAWRDMLQSLLPPKKD